jgi:hypothetical protein
MSSHPIKMLLAVEDNRGDARLFREMFNDQGSHNTQMILVECMRRCGEVPCRASG